MEEDSETESEEEDGGHRPPPRDEARRSESMAAPGTVPPPPPPPMPKEGPQPPPLPPNPDQVIIRRDYNPKGLFFTAVLFATMVKLWRHYGHLCLSSGFCVLALW